MANFKVGPNFLPEFVTPTIPSKPQIPFLDSVSELFQAPESSQPAAKDSLESKPQAAGSSQTTAAFVDETPAEDPAITKLKEMKPAELAKLGKTDKKAFFAALLPAALESERKYGVPAEVTLAQAALESGWAKSPIGGYNIFGIKGSGPAGSVKLGTVEYGNQATKARFAKYHNFYEAIGEHGKVYNNGSYKKGMAQYAKDKNPQKFIDNIAKIYATTPGYGATLKSMISKYKLQDMAHASRQASKRPTE